MSEKMDENPNEQSRPQDGFVSSPTTQQMRTVGQRRRDAEEKLEHHLEEARHKEPPHVHSHAKEDAATGDDAEPAAGEGAPTEDNAGKKDEAGKKDGAGQEDDAAAG